MGDNELQRVAAKMRAHNLTHGSGCWMRALAARERQRRARWAAKIRWDRVRRSR